MENTLLPFIWNNFSGFKSEVKDCISKYLIGKEFYYFENMNNAELQQLLNKKRPYIYICTIYSEGYHEQKIVVTAVTIAMNYHNNINNAIHLEMTTGSPRQIFKKINQLFGYASSIIPTHSAIEPTNNYWKNEYQNDLAISKIDINSKSPAELKSIFQDEFKLINDDVNQKPSTTALTKELINSKTQNIFDECVHTAMKQNPLSSTAVFQNLFQLCGSQKVPQLKKQYVQGIDMSQPLNVLKSFSLLYTSNAIYRQLNVDLKDYKLPMGPEIIACLTSQVQQLISTGHKEEIQIKSQSVMLYRGIREKTSLKVSQKANWPAFSSTSLQPSVAKSFAGGTGQVYTISLSKPSHSHIKIDGTVLASTFPNEKEVLLFPNFKFQVNNVSQSQQRSLSVSQVA